LDQASDRLDAIDANDGIVADRSLPDRSVKDAVLDVTDGLPTAE
jgi:hypothetical protein